MAVCDIAALGELLVDFTCTGQDGQGFPTLAAHPGGAPANFLAAAAKYGAKTALLAKVGDDAFGQLLRNALIRAGIGTDGLITDDSVFTTLAFVTLEDSGERSFSFARKPGADTQLRFDELDLNLIRTAKVFHFGTLSLTHEPARSATRQAVAYAKSLGKLISFDPNLRLPLWPDPRSARAEILWGLEQADVVKLSREEGEFLFGDGPEAAASRICTQHQAKLVFVTCGADGCLFRNRLACGHVAAPRGIKAVDTTGAGDIFGGAARRKLLMLGKQPDQLTQAELLNTARFACAAASLSTQTPGGLSSVPEYEDVCRLLTVYDPKEN